MPFIRYIRENPFSVFALCNIAGDLGYLGFAFAAQGWVSGPKLAGALFTMVAHVILLAYGDDQARHIEKETGAASWLMKRLRVFAQEALQRLPEYIQRPIRAKPVGVPFMMLTLNGVGLFTDAAMHPLVPASYAQMMLGACIVMGCGMFTLADFVKGQRLADILLKIGPSFLVGASVACAGLVLTTFNFFITASFLIFLLSNFVSFYTRIDKDIP